MIALGKMYHKKGWTQQLHLGAIRDNNKRLLKQLGPENIVIAIAGNKSDLENEREIETVDALNYAKSMGPDTLFLETSAKTDTNVGDLFKQISNKNNTNVKQNFKQNQMIKIKSKLNRIKENSDNLKYRINDKNEEENVLN